MKNRTALSLGGLAVLGSIGFVLVSGNHLAPPKAGAEIRTEITTVTRSTSSISTTTVPTTVQAPARTLPGQRIEVTTTRVLVPAPVTVTVTTLPPVPATSSAPSVTTTQTTTP